MTLSELIEARKGATEVINRRIVPLVAESPTETIPAVAAMPIADMAQSPEVQRAIVRGGASPDLLPIPRLIGEDGAVRPGFEKMAEPGSVRAAEDMTAIFDAIGDAYGAFSIMRDAESAVRAAVIRALVNGAVIEDFRSWSRVHTPDAWEWREGRKGRAAGWYPKGGTAATKFLSLANRCMREVGMRKPDLTPEQVAANLKARLDRAEELLRKNNRL